jgi:hypothetical protein
MSIIRDGLLSADLDAPVILPTLSLDFANSQSLDKRITFSRGSIGTRVNRNGLIETIPANQPRFDFDPISGECKGLLIEESRTNLITTSNSFGSGDANYGITASATTSPDGTTNASLIYEKNTFSFKLLSLSATTVIGTTYCGSAFVKYAGSSKYGRIKVGSTNTITINLTNGAILSSTGTCGVIPYPNGWYRIYCIWTATTTSENIQIFLQNYNGLSSLYQGDGSSGYYVYGMQAEAGAFPTSYIPTSASTVTRSADTASMTGTNFSSWYNQSEGSMVAEFSTIYEGSQVSGRSPGVWGLSQPTTEYANVNGYGLIVRSDTRLFSFQHRYVSSSIDISELLFGSTTSSTVQPYAKQKVSCAFLKDLMRCSIKGTSVLQIRDTNYNSLSQTALLIGTQRAGGAAIRELSGCISRLTYYPKAFSPAQLQYLTQ